MGQLNFNALHCVVFLSEEAADSFLNRGEKSRKSPLKSPLIFIMLSDTY